MDLNDVTVLDTGGPTPPGHPIAPHRWKLTPGGRVDTFAMEWDDPEGFSGHNGPECEVCGLLFCEHCHEWWATPCPSDALELDP